MFLLSPACLFHILMQQQYDYVFIFDINHCNICRQEFNWLYTAPEGGGQLKTQQPSKAPSTSAQKRAISFGHRTKRSGHEKISKRHIRFMTFKTSTQKTYEY